MWFKRKKTYTLATPLFWKLITVYAVTAGLVVWMTCTLIKGVISLLILSLAGFMHFYLTKRAIQPLQESLQEAEKKRNKILDDLAHELRTPLANMTGYLEALSNGVLEGEPRLYRALHKEALRIANLIDKLYLLHDQAYKQVHNLNVKQKVNIKKVIEESVQLFAWDFQQHQVPYHLQVEEAYVYGDADSLKQVLNNLLQNALQYRVKETEITCLGRKEKEHYYISISGAGLAIPAEDRQKIFERFYRVDPSRNRETGGDGLGLSIVKEIVDHHQGEVGLDTDGKEHTFWIRLPLSK